MAYALMRDNPKFKGDPDELIRAMADTFITDGMMRLILTRGALIGGYVMVCHC